LRPKNNLVDIQAGLQIEKFFDSTRTVVDRRGE
jgi:hypothetical protein